MPVPIAVAIAATVTRALAAQAAKQGVKQLTKNEARIVAKKAVRQIAAKSRSQSDKSRAVSGKQLDALINKANLSARSTKPVRNAKGLRTTTGQGGKRISNVSATRIAEQSAGPKARRLGGETGLRATAPKPGVRVTTKISGGGTTKVGPSQKINVKLTKRAEGPSRLSGKEFQKPPIKTKEISSERTPTFGKEKITTSRPVKRETNKKGSAITVRKTQPRKPAEVRAQQAKERRDRLREVLTPRVNPARPKTAPKRGSDGASKTSAREQELIDRYYRIRFRDSGGPTPRSAQGPQSSIESRIASGSERPTRGRGPSTFDKEAEARITAGLRNRKGGEYDLGKGKKADLPNSKAIAEAARKRPGLRKRKEAAVNESRARANAAMTKRGMTPAEKKTAVMKARAKARKIAKNTGGQ